MNGKKRDGEYFTNFETGGLTKFVNPGDPTENTGVGDGIWVDSDDFSSGDRNFVMGSGPFNIAVGDSQEIIIAYVVGIGNDALDSVTKLKEKIPLLQEIANNFFDIEVDPALDFGLEISNTQIVGDNYNDDRVANNGETLKIKIDVTNTSSQDYTNILVKPLPPGQFADGSEIKLIPNLSSNSFYTFEGENLILLKAADNATEAISHQIAFFDSSYSIYQTIPYTIPIEQLYFTPLEIDTINQISGYGDAVLGFRYVKPHEATADSYKVEITAQVFDNNGNLNDGFGVTLTNLTTGIKMLDHFELPSKYGFDYPSTEGFKLIFIDSIETDLKYISVVANASGSLTPPVDCLASWALPDYLIVDGSYENQQSLSNAVWLIDIYPYYWDDTATYQEMFKDVIFSSSGGVWSSNHGISALIPNDFEIRFTGNGKAINYHGDQNIVDIPFECWNVGNIDDTSDDYKLICYFSDQDSNNIWNLQYGGTYPSDDRADHEISSGLNDPWADWIYVLSPTNETPGTQGYDNFMAEAINNPAITTGDRRYTNLPRIYASPGDNDPDGPLDAWNVLSNLCFVLLDGGFVSTATSPMDYIAQSPEIGTIFRITTNKPLTAGDTYTFTTQKFDIKDPNIPNKFKLYQNYPNPFNDETNIHFDIKETVDLDIKIYNILGQEIFRYNIKQQPPGYHSVRWNGKSSDGNQMPTGIYLITMTAGDFKQSKKLVLLK